MTINDDDDADDDDDDTDDTFSVVLISHATIGALSRSSRLQLTARMLHDIHVHTVPVTPTSHQHMRTSTFSPSITCSTYRLLLLR